MKIAVLLLTTIFLLTNNAYAGGIFNPYPYYQADSDGSDLTLTINSGDSYEINSLPPFVTTSDPMSGSGPTTLTLNIQPLDLKSFRNGEISIAGYGLFYIYQRGTTAQVLANTMPLSSSSRVISAAGTNSELLISGPVESLTLNGTFANLAPGSSAENLYLDTSANTGNEFRYLRIIDSEDYQTVFVQPTADVVSVPETMIQFDYIDPFDFPTSRTISIPVTTAPDATWLAYSTVPWARLNDPPVRTGSSEIILTYFPQLVPNQDWNGTIHINNTRIELDAMNAIAPIETWCQLDIDELNIVDNGGGVYTVWIQNYYNRQNPGASECTFDPFVESQDPWIEVLSSSPVHTTYRVLPNNTGESRSGMITIFPNDFNTEEGDHASHTVIQTNLGKSSVNEALWRVD